jgi:UDP-N-acetyl-D-mannosaminuronate dehydrogenase
LRRCCARATGDPRIDFAGRHHGACSRLAAAARPDLRFPQHGGEAADIAMAYCPERVLPGHVLKELVAMTASSAA